jgi:hypothetical protein
MNRSFRNVAAEYCAWVEGRTVPEDVGLWLARILAELIHVVYGTPDDGGADAGPGEEDGYKARSYNDVRGSLPKLPFQYYREVYEATDLENDESSLGELYDDIADIYGDLSKGLFVHEHHSPGRAERYWRQSFRYHWGEHATGALRALYWHLRKKAYEE